LRHWRRLRPAFAETKLRLRAGRSDDMKTAVFIRSSLVEIIRNTMKYSSKNAQETEKLGKKLVSKLRGGETIALTGDLGSGKTVFAKGVAKALGIRKKITSPTFVLWRLYQIPKPGRIKYLCHIDLYRLTQSQDILALGINEYWQRKDTVCLIEWAEKIKRFLPRKNLFLVKFEISDLNTRKIIIDGVSDVRS